MLDRDPSMLNVAISRAQDAFLVFGDMHLFHPDGDRPSAIVGRALFKGTESEIPIPAEWLAAGFDMSPAALIRDLAGHRRALVEAFSVARARLVITSPFLSLRAIQADGVLEMIRKAVARGVVVTIVSDPSFDSKNEDVYQRCVECLSEAGARVREKHVHSKLLLVDFEWLVVGSFNWLSATRGEGQRYARYESSLRYDGEEAFEMIGRSLSDLKGLVDLSRSSRSVVVSQ